MSQTSDVVEELPLEGDEGGAHLTGRNLVVCCDGTGNMWGNQHDTNVVKLARACVKDNAQILYYDPGVGTASGFPAVGALQSLLFRLKLLVGLALGSGIYENIGSAYTFLIHNYKPGDRVFLFGFSRGAFTARAVSGMVNLFGIVRPAGEVMVPTLLRIYFSDRGATRQALATDIRENFTDPPGHEARIYFIGVWDTVATVGGLTSRTISSDASTANKRFDHIRHAISNAEYRDTYAPRLYDGANQDLPTRRRTSDGTSEFRPSLKQLWFDGVHSDVGGSYADAGLSDFALAWMFDEACAAGLQVKAPPPMSPNLRACAHDQCFSGFLGPWWALTGLQRRTPAPAALRHPSLAARETNPRSSPATWQPALATRGVWLAMAVYVLLCIKMLLVANSVDPASANGLVDLSYLQLFAASDSSIARAPIYRSQLIALTVWDLISIPVYTHLLCIACVHAVRRLRDWRADSEAVHRALRLALWIGLILTPIADITEDGLTVFFIDCPGKTSGMLLAIASAVKWLGLAVVVLGATFGLIAGKPPVARCSPHD